MKSRFVYIIAGIVSLSIGCSPKEEFRPNYEFDGTSQKDYRVEILQAILANDFPATKYTIDNQGNTAWELIDEIAVCLYDTETEKCEYKTATSLGAGKFYLGFDDKYERDFFAIYPSWWADANNYGEPDLKVELPVDYYYDEIASPNFGVGMIAINNSTNPTLIFRRICGSLRLKITDVPADTKFFSVVFDKRVTGNFKVINPWTATPYIAVDDTTPTAIEVQFFTPTTDNSYEINIPMPTGQYGTIAVTALDANKNEKASGNATFSKNITTNSFEFFTLALQNASPISTVTTTPMDVETINIQDGNHNTTWN